MANEKFYDADGSVKYRKTSGDGSLGDPAVAHNNVDNCALPTGAATLAEQQTQTTAIGATSETAPANDTATVGLNGRLQRIAQRITSLIALIPAALTGSGNFKVAVQESLPAGTAAIGKLAANSGVVIGDVNVTTQPARVRTTDTISAATATDALMSGTTALTPKFAKFSSATSGNVAFIAAVGGKKLRILSMQLQAASAAAANAVYINDGTVDLYGDSTRKIPLDVTGVAGPSGFSLGENRFGHFETADVNRPINVNLGVAAGVVGICTYVEV